MADTHLSLLAVALSASAAMVASGCGPDLITRMASAGGTEGNGDEVGGDGDRFDVGDGDEDEDGGGGGDGGKEDGDGGKEDGDGDGDENPLLGVVAPQDGFDALRDRWIIRSAGYDHSTLVGVDMDSGDQAAIVQSWPWPDEHTTFAWDFALDETLEHAYAHVSHVYFDEGSGSCVTKEYVSIDLDDGSVLQLDQLDFYCCDDCEGDGWRSDPVIDAANQSLRYIYADYGSDWCYVGGIDPITAELGSSHWFYDSLWNTEPRDLVVDPLSADSVLVLAELGSVVRLDHEVGEVELVAEVPEQWGQLVFDLDAYQQWMVLDYERRRAFVTAPTNDAHATVRIDLDTNEQSLLYAGEAIEGELLRCVDDVAFDSLRNRILYHNEADDYGPNNCVEGFYAVDVESGVRERLFAP